MLFVNSSTPTCSATPPRRGLAPWRSLIVLLALLVTSTGLSRAEPFTSGAGPVVEPLPPSGATEKQSAATEKQKEAAVKSSAAKSGSGVKVAKAAESKSNPAALALNERGIAAVKAKDFVNAEDLFRKALASDPNNLTAVFNLAGVYLVNNRPEAAVSLLEQYTANHVDDAGLFVRLGDAYFATHKINQARRAYETVLKLAPNYQGLAGKLGTVYMLSNRPADAEKMLRVVALQKPKDGAALANLSSVLLGNGKHAEAIATAKRALQLKATKEVYVTLGTAYELTKDYKNALVAFERAVDLGDKRPELARKIAGLKTALPNG